MMEKPTFTNQIRKKITMNEAADMVEDMYGKTLGLKTLLAEKEAKLADAKKIEAQNLKISHLINNKLDFGKQKSFKRQNSYAPMLDDFGDMDDFDTIQTKVKQMRTSLQRPRNKQNLIVKDVTEFRLKKDVALMSETQPSQEDGESADPYGPKQGRGMRRTIDSKGYGTGADFPQNQEFEDQKKKVEEHDQFIKGLIE